MEADGGLRLERQRELGWQGEEEWCARPALVPAASRLRLSRRTGEEKEQQKERRGVGHHPSGPARRGGRGRGMRGRESRERGGASGTREDRLSGENERRESGEKRGEMGEGKGRE
eukprot:scaffold142107_cov28-Tisochrysis_lutea.AAC.1